jgi:hypothetical protein
MVSGSPLYPTIYSSYKVPIHLIHAVVTSISIHDESPFAQNSNRYL